MTDGKPSSQPTPAAPESKPAPAGAEVKPEPKPTPAEPKPASDAPKSEEKVSKKEESVTQLGSNLPLAPNAVVTDKNQITSAATLQEDRVPGVQYPASSNQLPVDFESQDQETPQQRADREVAEKVAKLNESNADLLAAAGSSGDADIHQLLAHRGVAEQNGDEAALNAVDEKLKQRLSV